MTSAAAFVGMFWVWTPAIVEEDWHLALKHGVCGCVFQGVPDVNFSNSTTWNENACRNPVYKVIYNALVKFQRNTRFARPREQLTIYHYCQQPHCTLRSCCGKSFYSANCIRKIVGPSRCLYTQNDICQFSIFLRNVSQAARSVQSWQKSAAYVLEMGYLFLHVPQCLLWVRLQARTPRCWYLQMENIDGAHLTRRLAMKLNVPFSAVPRFIQMRKRSSL